jgi:hypothetical protein
MIGTVSIFTELGEFANCKTYSSIKDRKKIIEEFISRYRLKNKDFILQIAPYDKVSQDISGSIVIKNKDEILVDTFYNSVEERENLISNYNSSENTIEIIPDYDKN